MSDLLILTAVATYKDGKPRDGLLHLLDEAREMGAKVQLDTDEDEARIILTRSSTEPDLMLVAQTLAEMTMALPSGASSTTSSWRWSGPVPF